MGCVQDAFGSRSLKNVPNDLDTLALLWSGSGSSPVTSCLIPTDGSPDQAGLPPTKWEDFEFLHIACHGKFPEERPLDAALYLGKEALRVSEFFAVRLRAKLVSLSACSLGRHTQHHFGVDLAGDEWLGLYLSLFYAGAQALLVSLWDANSQVAALFMKALHTALSQEASPAEAFQQAVKSVHGKPIPYSANWYLVGFPETH
jgi:CHAT domain-containing protein